MIHLRKLKIEDAEGILEWMYDPDIAKAFRFNAADKNRETVLEFIRCAETAPVDGGDIHYSIADETNEYLGTISLKSVDLVAKKAEYAISLKKSAWGKGIAFQATLEILQRAFKEFGLERIYLNVFSDNKRAIRLYEKCGFIYEGEFRKHLFLRGEYKSLKWYGMLKEEYLATHDRIERSCDS